MSSIIETLQEEFLETLSSEDLRTKRFYEFPEAEGVIEVAIGIRRSGKTCFLWQTIGSYPPKGVLH